MKKNATIVFTLITGIILLTSFACTRRVDQSPREINFDRNVCVLCLMGLADPKYSAQSINTRGDVVWFDDLGCLIFWMEKPGWEKFEGENAVSYIADSETGEWLKVEEVWYTFGKQTPMGYGYSAVKQKVDTAFDYATTVQRIKDGITMREEFLKKKKMLHHDM
jgi:copper chaperone NosL